MNRKRLIPLLGIIALMVAFFIFKPDRPAEVSRESGREKNPSPADHPTRTERFDRRISPLIYTKHARCRMACRHIDEVEVREILEKGRINNQKSDPSSRPDPKYALEGITRDNQEVRIIFAPSDRGMVVITVIDLQNEWNCDCK